MNNIHIEQYCKDNIKTLYLPDLKLEPIKIIKHFHNIYFNQITPWGGNRIYFICENIYDESTDIFCVKAYNSKSKSFDLYMGIDFDNYITFDTYNDSPHQRGMGWKFEEVNCIKRLFNITSNCYLNIKNKSLNVIKDIDNVNIFVS